VKHGTASVFVFARFEDTWRIALIEHPRFHRLMIPGGHIEPGESAGDGAVREVMEETGLAARLIPAPGAALPAGYAGVLAARPWWMAEYQVPPDGHLATDHVHVDHLYVAIASDPDPASPPAHPVAWYAAPELCGLRMFEDTRALAAVLLEGLNGQLPEAADGIGDEVVRAALLAGLA
jgi:8-oxo-dGTP pyrophosphatase MutT (NUDIX family)